MRRSLAALAVATLLLLPGRAAGEPRAGLSTARDLSGTARPDETLAPGTLAVRLTYDDLDDPKPPRGVPVTLVGYRVDGETTVLRERADERGAATFSGLDTTGDTAYFAMALLPRNRDHDRLLSEAVQLDPSHGARLFLSGERRSARADAIDDLARERATAVPRRRVRIDLVGRRDDATTEVRVVDAASGRAVGAGVVIGSGGEITIRAKRGQALYAEAVVEGERQRSQPFLAADERGAKVTIWFAPDLLVGMHWFLVAEHDRLLVAGRLFIANPSWIPFGAGVELPLPRDARGVRVEGASRARIAVTADGLRLERAVRPGQQEIEVHLELPGKRGTASFALDLPRGVFQGKVGVHQATKVVPPAGAEVRDRSSERIGRYFELPDITMMPGSRLEVGVHLPRATKAEIAVARACRPLSLEHSPLVGERMPEVVARSLDGNTRRLSSLAGRPLLVNFMASWDMMSGDERPTFAAIRRAAKSVAIVVVASDLDPQVVRSAVGPKPGYRVLVDPPEGDEAFGTNARSWDVERVPETFLVDRAGIVRAYLQGGRDWSTPEAIRCVRAIAGL